MPKNSELEFVCRHILSILANALSSASPTNENIINISSAKKKLSNQHKHQKAISVEAIPPETD